MVISQAVLQVTQDEILFPVSRCKLVQLVQRLGCL